MYLINAIDITGTLNTRFAASPNVSNVLAAEYVSSFLAFIPPSVEYVGLVGYVGIVRIVGLVAFVALVALVEFVAFVPLVPPKLVAFVTLVVFVPYVAFVPLIPLVKFVPLITGSFNLGNLSLLADNCDDAVSPDNISFNDVPITTSTEQFTLLRVSSKEVVAV